MDQYWVYSKETMYVRVYIFDFTCLHFDFTTAVDKISMAGCETIDGAADTLYTWSCELNRHFYIHLDISKC